MIFIIGSNRPQVGYDRVTKNSVFNIKHYSKKDLLDSYGYTYKQWDVFINKWYDVCSVWILWSMNFPIRYFMSQHATECNTRIYSEIVEFNKRVDHPSNRSFPLTPFPFTFSSNNPCIFIINPTSSTISNKRFFQFTIMNSPTLKGIWFELMVSLPFGTSSIMMVP